MAEMAKDLDKKGSQPALDADGKAIMVDVKDSNGNITQQPATIAQAVTAGLKPVGDTATSYMSQNKAFGTGGYGSIMLTAIVGAASGNVTGSGSALLQNTAINVLRQYGAQQIKTIADGFRPAGATTDDALSGSIRAALHAIAGCAGAAATGGDCTSAAAGSAATVALNNLIGADTTKMNAEQKQAYSNLMGTLVAGVTAGVGGDAAAAQLAGKIEVENNYLGRLTANGYNQMIDKQCGGLPTHAQSGCVQGIKDKAIATSDRLNKEMLAACSSDPTGSACSNARESARWFVDSDIAQSLGMGAGSRAALIKADALVSYAGVAHTVNTKPPINVSTSVIQATPLTPQQQYLAGLNSTQSINAANPLAMQDMTGGYLADTFMNSLGESIGSLGILGSPTGSYDATTLTNQYSGAHINPNDARNNVVLDLVTTAVPVGGTRGVKVAEVAEEPVIMNVVNQPTLQNVGNDASQALACVTACFVAGTFVHTDKGLQAIETFVGGELVLSRSDKTGVFAYSPVVATKVTPLQTIYEVVVQNAAGVIETYETTDEHPFWVVGEGWRKAALLESGMPLVDNHDELLHVVSVTKQDDLQTVFNIQVKEFETYHVGEFGTWVHNAKCCEVTLPAVNSYEQARNQALDLIGDLGADSQPVIGRLPASDGLGQIIGRQSADGKVRWRLDYDPDKGMHINVEDFRSGKGENAKKYVIPFNGNADTFNSLLRQLNN